MDLVSQPSQISMLRLAPDDQRDGLCFAVVASSDTAFSSSAHSMRT
jgi:hypothetical protein